MTASFPDRSRGRYLLDVGWIRRHGLRFALGTAATVAFLVLFIRQVDFSEAWDEMRKLPALTPVEALGLILVNIVAMTVRWGLLLEGAGSRVRFRQLFATVAVGRAANNVLPARGGDLLRIESMRETESIPVFVTAGTLFAERLMDGVVFAAWILLGALLVGNGGIPLLTGIALSSGVTVGVVLCWVAALHPDAAERFLWRISKRLPSRWQTRFARAGANFVEGLGAFRGARRFLLILGTSAVMWLADVAMFAIVGHAFGLDLEPGAYFLLEGIGNLALAVPTTAAGLGSFDYITLLTAKHVDISEETATAYVITMHALIVIPVTLLGACLVRPALPRLFARKTPDEAS